jgi:hypothetical protein
MVGLGVDGFRRFGWGFGGKSRGFAGLGAAAAEVAGQFASDGRRGYAWGETWRPGWEAGRRLPGPRGRIGWGESRRSLLPCPRREIAVGAG